MLHEASRDALAKRAGALNPMSAARAEISQAKIQQIVNGATYNAKRAIHIGLSKREIWIEE